MLITLAKLFQPAFQTRHFLFLLLALASITSTAISQAPDTNAYFARKNTFSFFGAYSNDSSHILMGTADNRRLVDIGAGYSRSIYINRIVDWEYSGEILPVALDSDPVQVTNATSTLVFNNGAPTETFKAVYYLPTVGPCVASTSTTTYQITNGTQTIVSVKTCSRRWTIGEAISPIGLQWNFMPRKKVQPYFIGHGGYMYSTQPIPVPNAGSFNFTFDLGAGLELFQSKGRSIRAEYRYHHISNHGTAAENPGIDNGAFQVTYSFGR